MRGTAAPRDRACQLNALAIVRARAWHRALSMWNFSLFWYETVGAKGMGGWVRRQGSRPEVLEGGVALERLSERHAALGAELVAVEPAHTAKGRVRRGECSEPWGRL